jgi:hypothetical protein
LLAVLGGGDGMDAYSAMAEGLVARFDPRRKKGFDFNVRMGKPQL